MIDPRKYDEWKKFFADAKIVASGELDAEYARLKGLCEEWDKRNNFAKLKADLEQGKIDLVTAKDVFEKQKTALEIGLKARESAVAKREQDLDAKLKEHATAKQSLAAAVGVHASTTAATKATQDAREAVIAKKEKELADFQGI